MCRNECHCGLRTPYSQMETLSQGEISGKLLFSKPMGEKQDSFQCNEKYLIFTPNFEENHKQQLMQN